VKFPTRSCKAYLRLTDSDSSSRQPDSAYHIPMKPRIVEMPSFSMVGITVRTNNSRGTGPNGAIPRTWQAFYTERLGERIRAKTDEGIIALYTDYADKRRGDFAFILGVRVRGAGPIPHGMVKNVGEGSIHVDKNQARTRGTRCARRVASYLEVRGSRNTGRYAKLYC
jgi:hypothetical protein